MRKVCWPLGEEIKIDSREKRKTGGERKDLLHSAAMGERKSGVDSTVISIKKGSLVLSEEKSGKIRKKIKKNHKKKQYKTGHSSHCNARQNTKGRKEGGGKVQGGGRENNSVSVKRKEKCEKQIGYQGKREKRQTRKAVIPPPP